MTFAELFAYARDMSKTAFNKHGQHWPLFLIDNRLMNNIDVVQVHFGSTAEKHQAMAIARKHIQKCFAAHYVFIVEAWMSHGPKAELPDNATVDDINRLVTPPSQDPDRDEAIMIIGESQTEKPLFGSWSIVRPKIGKPRVGEFTDYSSRGEYMAMNAMAGMLGPKGLFH